MVQTVGDEFKPHYLKKKKEKKRKENLSFPHLK
jgi:hypothetical protein